MVLQILQKYTCKLIGTWAVFAWHINTKWVRGFFLGGGRDHIKVGENGEEKGRSKSNFRRFPTKYNHS